jgi:hypothetical protein
MLKGSDGQSVAGSPHASSRSGSGVGPFLQSFESDSQTRNILSPSIGQDYSFSIGPQPQYRSSPSNSPYHDNLSDDADMTISAEITWLSGNDEIIQ